MTWRAPATDGHSPITRYVVEKAQVNSSSFTTAGHTGSDTFTFKVGQLDKGKRYLVRVYAENAIGQSEPVCLPDAVWLPYGESIIQLQTICIHSNKDSNSNAVNSNN